MHKKIKIEILTLAPLAISTGKNDGLIDNDILTDESGIPYINQRRLKGLLKEAVMETLEICGHNRVNEITNYLFGKKGSTIDDDQQRITLSDARIINYRQHKDAVHYKSIPINFVKSYYSTTIQQTAIDDQYLSAKKGSLRKIRAVKEGQKFSFDLDIHPDFEDLIKLAILQWSFMGSGRNNGLGNVRLSIKDDGTEIKEQLINRIANLIVPNAESKQVEPLNITEEAVQGADTISLNIELIDKILITGGSIGDQNTIQTKSYIDGRNIWGLMATKYMAKFGIDDDFKSIFRDQKVRFAPAFIGNAVPISVHKQVKSKSADFKLFNAFAVENEKESLRPKVGFITYKPNDDTPYLVAPKTISAFHFNREHYRRSGVSENGEIFYYNALEKGQVFCTRLEGAPSYILKLKTLIGSGLEGRIGASRGIEYGRVKITTNDSIGSSPPNNTEVKEFIFYFMSPGLIVNEYGYAAPTMRYLKLALEQKGLNIDDIKVISKFTTIQSHSGVWKSLTSHETYFDIGTAIQVHLTNAMSFLDIESMLKQGLGLNTNQGYGQVKVINQDFSAYQEAESNKNIRLTDAEKSKAEKSNLLMAYIAHSNQLEIKTKALGDAKKAKNISINNHQISRIKTLVSSSNDKTKLKKELDSYGYKPIAEIMNRLKWDSIPYDNYEDFKTYMMAYLDGKRLINNTKKRQTNDSK